MQSEIILLSNVKQDGLAQIVQNQFKLLGITNVKGKRIDAEENAVKTALSTSLSEYNVIMIIGGMDFDDDTTVTAVSETIGYSTVLKDGQKFPKGAEILRNHAGYPSGCVLSHGNQCIIMLPGIRETIEFMLCYRVTGYLAEFTSEHFCIRTLRAYGISKYDAEKAVADGGSFGTQSMVFEDDGEIAVQILTHGADDSQAKERNSAAVRNMIAALGSCVYAIDAENIGQALNQELTRKGLAVSIAVDGIAKDQFSRYSYISEYLENTANISHGIEFYDIPEKLIKRYGRNSDWAAAVMAGEATKAEGANIGIAITADRNRIREGAHIAVCIGDNVWTEKVNAENWEALQKMACMYAAHLARKVVSAYPKAYENAVSLVAAASGKSKFSTVSKSSGKKWYERFIPMKGDSGKEIARKVIFISSVLIFIGCMGFLSTKATDAIEHRSLAANLNNLFGNSSEEEVPDDWPFLASLYDLYQENEDLIGYIQIDDTNVSFPVVQTMEAGKGGETGQYYLRRDYYGNYSMYGTPFLDYRCAVNPSYATNNLIIYGHNIYNDGQMFSDLIKYRKLKFYKEHPVIEFDSLYGEGQYLIIGVVLANAYEKDGPVWGYNNFIDGTEEETSEFINQIAKRTMIVTGVDYNTSDTFLTLSTCCYDFTDARFVVLARKLRDGESVSDFDFTKAYYNSNPLMPDKWYQAIAEKQQEESDASFGDAETPETSESEIINVVADTSGMKTEYLVGEKLDLTGLVLIVTRQDTEGNITEEEVTEDLVFSETVFRNVGDQTITFKYEGFEFDIDVSVKENPNSSSGQSVSSQSEATIVSGKIDTSGGKTEYALGETFDPSDILLVLTMSDGTTKNVSISQLTCSGFDSTSVGEKTITVQYDSSHSYTFKITVSGAVAVSIAVSKGPTKSEYTVGEKFDPSGIEITVTYSDKTTKTLTEGFTVGTPNMNTPSEQIVNVTYMNCTASFKVTIKAASSSSTATSSVSSSSSEESSKSSQGSETPQSSSSGSSSSSESSSSESVAESSNVSENILTVSNSAQSSYYNSSLTDTISVNGTSMSIYEAVCRVVRYEAGVGQPDEHVKAQAVATYTYLKNQGSPTGVGMSAMTAVTDQIKSCVAEVIGYAVLDDTSNKYVLATYFSESCGYSADASWVWGYANRNLESVSIPVDNPSGYNYSITSSAFATLMGTGFDFSGDPSEWIEILNYEGSTPYVKQVRVGGVTIKARALREKYVGLAKLRSTAFTVRYDESTDKLIFTSYGYGHGVGMSAKASIAYAKKGYSWDEILLKFYSNCYIGMKY